MANRPGLKTIVTSGGFEIQIRSFKTIVSSHSSQMIGVESQDMPFLCKELLPGILNDTVLENIGTKLSWSDIHKLSLVSRSWQQAIQSRQVYDARFRHQSRETLLVIKIGDSFQEIKGIALYCFKENALYQLPPIQHDPKACQFIALDGKLYFFGSTESTGRFQNLHVLDVSRQRQWKKCASMLQSRQRFGCEVMHGKIFVFGGVIVEGGGDGDICGSEVYDPNLNTWSSIKPMVWGMPGLPQVMSVGDELFVEGKDKFGWQIYAPLQDKWRVVEPLRSHPVDGSWGQVFEAQGKLYLMSESRIQVYDAEKNSWIYQRSVAWNVGENRRDRVALLSVLPLNSELLGMPLNSELLGIGVFLTERGSPEPCLFQSSGFGRNNIQFVWSKVPSSSAWTWLPRYVGKFSGLMCPIQL